MDYIEAAGPVVKWVGGKRQLIHEIRKYLPHRDTISTYYEPFLGGGAVLFELQPKKAIVNDVNEELINLYEVIRDYPEDLLRELATYKSEAEYYYYIRKLDRNKEAYEQLNQIQRAARIHYLNKTCYNGLFRVNLAGEFNTPFGSYKNPNIENRDTILAVSRYFNKAKIVFKHVDFEEAVKGARKQQFVYFDPPYDPVSASSNFTGYASGGFSRKEQLRLKKCCDRLTKHGVKVLLSNSATPFILDLYNDERYKIEMIKARRAVNSDASLRGEVSEVLVRNYD